MFPKDPAIRAKWIVAVRREGLVITPNTAVCCSHFREQDFRTDVNVQGECFCNSYYPSHLSISSLSFELGLTGL